MNSMAISMFKTNALRLIDQVAKTKQPIVITKRGKPLAELIPFYAAESTPKPGMLSDTLLFEKDLVSPLGADIWDACR